MTEFEHSLACTASPAIMARRVTIVLLPGSSLMNAASVADPLRAANRLSRRQLYEWRLVSADGTPPRLSNGMDFPVAGPLRPDDQGDVLVVIAGFDQQRHAGQPFLRTLASAGRNFSMLCGVEAGTWLLARAGLAGNRSVTTHWEDLEQLQAAYPDLDVRRDRVVIDGRIRTAGGASPALDMMLHLVGEQHGSALAMDVASVFIYDQAHSLADPQPVVSHGQLSRREPRLAAAIGLMERTIDRPVPVPGIARRCGMSVRMLELQFRRHLGESPGRFYLSMRLQSARKMVTDTGLSMQEIAIRTGFSSQSALSRSFRQAYGESPMHLRMKR